MSGLRSEEDSGISLDGDEHDFYDDDVSIDPDLMERKPRPPGRAREMHPDDPTQGNVEQAMGFYSDGALINASELPLEGLGFIKLFQPRKRNYGTYDLITIIETVARGLHELFPSGERLQVGDTAKRYGGFIGSHASHQNGLDADIALMRLNHTEQDPMSVKGFEETFVRGKQVSGNFDSERNWTMLKLLVNTKRVNRIFIDPLLKRNLCDFAKKKGEYDVKSEYLRALRPWPNHRDHFHVRITCPDKSPHCEVQEPTPEGSGCAAVEWADKQGPARPRLPKKPVRPHP